MDSMVSKRASDWAGNMEVILQRVHNWVTFGQTLIDCSGNSETSSMYLYTSGFSLESPSTTPRTHVFVPGSMAVQRPSPLGQSSSHFCWNSVSVVLGESGCTEVCMYFTLPFSFKKV